MCLTGAGNFCPSSLSLVCSGSLSDGHIPQTLTPSSMEVSLSEELAWDKRGSVWLLTEEQCITCLMSSPSPIRWTYWTSSPLFECSKYRECAASLDGLIIIFFCLLLLLCVFCRAHRAIESHKIIWSMYLVLPYNKTPLTAVNRVTAENPGWVPARRTTLRL